MTLSFRLSDIEHKIIKNYVKNNNISMSEFLKKAALEKIEDEYDLEELKAALEYNGKNSEQYTLEQIKEELSL